MHNGDESEGVGHATGQLFPTVVVPIEESTISWRIQNLTTLMQEMLHIENPEHENLKHPFKPWFTSIQLEVGQKIGNRTKWQVGLCRQEKFKDYLCLYLTRIDDIAPSESFRFQAPNYGNDIFVTCELLNIELPHKRRWTKVTPQVFTNLFPQEPSEQRLTGWHDAIKIKDELLPQPNYDRMDELPKNHHQLSGIDENDDVVTIHLRLKFQYAKSIEVIPKNRPSPGVEPDSKRSKPSFSEGEDANEKGEEKSEGQNDDQPQSYNSQPPIPLFSEEVSEGQKSSENTQGKDTVKQPSLFQAAEWDVKTLNPKPDSIWNYKSK